jgi:hypothetical protein
MLCAMLEHVGMIAIIISLLMVQVDDAKAEVTPSVEAPITMTRFSDIYSEGTGLSKAQTVATYLQVRSGFDLQSSFQTYAALRLGADSRTVLDNTDAVYNDNYVFFGLGIDYLKLLPGVRLTTQLGASEDLNSKIHLGGLDTRTGVVSYHELRYGNSPLNFELYSESFYIRRYRNILAAGQARVFYDLLKFPVHLPFLSSSSKLEFASMVNFVLGADSSGTDYNRYGEMRVGMRIRMAGMSSLIFMPYYTFGTRWQRPTDYPTYRDLRGLLAFYTSF